MLGHSRPSLVDGVVRYKQKLGARLCAVRYPQAKLGIAVARGQRALFDRLNRRQLVEVRGRGLVRVLEAS
jgi:cyanophycinase-like exopeptidase